MKDVLFEFRANLKEGEKERENIARKLEGMKQELGSLKNEVGDKDEETTEEGDLECSLIGEDEEEKGLGVSKVEGRDLPKKPVEEVVIQNPIEKEHKKVEEIKLVEGKVNIREEDPSSFVGHHQLVAPCLVTHQRKSFEDGSTEACGSGGGPGLRRIYGDLDVFHDENMEVVVAWRSGSMVGQMENHGEEKLGEERGCLTVRGVAIQRKGWGSFLKGPLQDLIVFSRVEGEKKGGM